MSRHRGPGLRIRLTRSLAAALALGGIALAGGCAASTRQSVRPPAPTAAVATAPGAGAVTADQLRALHDRAEALIEAAQRSEVPALAGRCVELATRAEAERPGRVFAPYYRALCRAQILRASTGLWKRAREARALAKQVERDAAEAVRRDEGYEQGGPLRLLGMFYVRAPRWPIGPGDPDKGTTLLLRGRDRFPQSPLNRLFYAEALLARGEEQAARRELEALREADLEPKWRKLWERLRSG